MADIQDIGVLTDLSRSQIFNLCKGFLTKGISAIKDKREGKPKELLTKKERETIVEMVKTKTPKDCGYVSEYWTTGILGNWIEQEYKAKYKSKTSLYLVFKQARFTYHKPGMVYREHDEQEIEQWEKEENVSSGSLVERIRGNERETQEKLDNLITLYLDGDIPKVNYLAKKDELLLQKVSLAHKMDSARQERKNWVEPLREWILDMKKATQLVSSDNFFEIRDYFKKIGTNSQLRDKSVSISFCPPTEFACARRADFKFSPPCAPSARPHFSLTPDQVSFCDPTGNRTRITGLKSRCPNR